MIPVAILAGGLATRLRPVTQTIPKSLVNVGGRPFITWQLEWLARQRVRRVSLCVGHLGQMIEEVIGDGHRFGLEVSYSYDGPTLLGTGGALRRALGQLGDAFFVLYGDSYLDCDLDSVHRAHIGSGKMATMTVYRNEGRWDESNVVFSGGEIILYDKKHRSKDMQYIDYGLGVLTARTLLHGPENVPCDLADIYTNLSRRGQLAGYEVAGRFYEIGSFSGLREAEEFFKGMNSGIRAGAPPGSSRDHQAD